MAEAVDKAPAPKSSPPISTPPTHDKPAAKTDDKASPPGGNAVAAKAPTAPIELQGQSSFNASAEVLEYIKGAGAKGAAIPVKFGNVSKAGDTIHIAGEGKTLHTVGIGSVPIDHPFFQPLQAFEPRLAIKIKEGAISGYAAPKKSLVPVEAIDKVIADNAALLGLVGFRFPKLNLQNKIEAGTFKLGTQDPVNVKLAGWITMALGIGLENEKVQFTASGKVQVRGLAETELNLIRAPDGHITGQADLAINIAKFSGKATAKYDNGQVNVTGTVSYATEKLRGSLTVVAMEAKDAEKAARDQIDPQHLATEETSDKEKGKKPERLKSGERGIAGWGELDFAFTDWFTGKAKAIFGPAGYITIIGKIAPPKSVELMKEHPWDKHIFGVSIDARYGVPYVADIHVGIGIDLGAVARIGPAELTDIVVEGVYSTDPTVLNSFSITGAFRISAYAGLNLRFEGHAGLTILKHDVEFGAAVTGKAGVKGYAEARPTLGYREKAEPNAGKKGEYFLKGHLEIAAQPFVGLDGELFVRLRSPWWSPAPNKTWTWPLFSLEYPLPGEFGIGADVDYVIGSGKFPEVQFGKVDFDASKFKESLLDRKIPDKKVGGDVEKAGNWKGEAPAPPTTAPAPPKSGGKAPGTAGPKAGADSTTVPKGGQTPEESGAVPRTKDAAQRFAAGMEALGELHQIAEKDPETREELDLHLDALKKKYGFTKLDAHPVGDYWVIDAALNSKANDRTVKKKHSKDPKDPKAQKTETDPAKNLHERTGWVDKYGEQKRVTGDGTVDRDHQPSKAAIKRAAALEAEKMLENGLISKMPTAAQVSEINDRIEKEALSVVVPHDVHAAGPTHGSKNKPLIDTDATALGAAAKRDAKAMVANARALGKDDLGKYKRAAELIKSQTHDSIIKWVRRIIKDVLKSSEKK